MRIILSSLGRLRCISYEERGLCTSPDYLEHCVRAQWHNHIQRYIIVHHGSEIDWPRRSLLASLHSPCTDERGRASTRLKGSELIKTHSLHFYGTMRLINIHTLDLEEFFDPPQYAVLSHRWIGREITFEQFMDPVQRVGAAFRKIAHFCELLRNGAPRLPVCVDWAWVDTCCINKQSSSKLSEAINSMWQWHWDAEYCIAWLHDVTQSDNSYAEQVQGSEWLTRGWTLQEMLAPKQVYFCDKEWQIIGSRNSLRFDLS